MPRHLRCVVPGLAYHVTQRGVDRCTTFADDADRWTYLKLLKTTRAEAEARVLAWCLMSNHVHLIAVPDDTDALGVLLRRVHGRYAQYFNARHDRSGHLWQNRYFSCPLGPTHLWTAFAYVETNPVRARLVTEPADYQWSSAKAHLSGRDPIGLLDMKPWTEYGGVEGWRLLLGTGDEAACRELQRCTYSGRPFGDEGFLASFSERFGRRWKRGRPPKSSAVSDGRSNLPCFRQDSLFAAVATEENRASSG
jgi:putative transposase